MENNLKNLKRKRTVTESSKKSIAGKQKYKCANNPNNVLKGLENYKCPLWTNIGDGSFDESGYEIDHIIEHSTGGVDNSNNLQALCLMCHRVKTKRFLQNNSNNHNYIDIKTDEEEYISASEYTQIIDNVVIRVEELIQNIINEKRHNKAITHILKELSDKNKIYRNQINMLNQELDRYKPKINNIYENDIV